MSEGLLPQSLEGLFPAPLRRRLLGLRQDLHRRPELSGEEAETARRLYDELASLEPIHLERVADHGVVARFAGRDPRLPPVALRGDTDALPIQEDTGLPYASEKPGVMHACGHDVHATWAVGAAALLAEEPAAGDVVVVLQPAEEIAEGAAAILDSGALDDVAMIFGGHVDRRFQVGEVVADDGPLAASADLFEIELRGRGAHGARPHEGADPVVGAAAFIQAVQTIVSRRLDPGAPAVVTVGSVHAGRAGNVIPDKAELAGTFRATDAATRQAIREELRHLVEGVAASHRLEGRIDFAHGTPPVVNDPQAAEICREAVKELLGGEALRPFGLVNMAGEDFAYYLEKMPGAFLRIGAREKGGEIIPAHSPRFYAADGAIFVGAAVLAQSARKGSEQYL